MTPAFLEGAAAAVRLARDTGCRHALLTEGSPSCGVHRVHGGRFDGTTTPGEGVVAAALRAAGLAVYSHEEAEALALAVAAAEKTGPIAAGFVDSPPRFPYLAGLHRRFLRSDATRVLRDRTDRVTEKTDVEADIPALEPRAASGATGSARAWPPRPAARS